MRMLKTSIFAAGGVVAVWGLLQLVKPPSAVDADSASMPVSVEVNQPKELHSVVVEALPVDTTAVEPEIVEPQVPVLPSELVESDAVTSESPLEGSPLAPSPDVLDQVVVQMDPPLRELGRAWQTEDGRNDFSMPLPNGDELEIEVERFVAIGATGGEFTGNVKGYPDSSVTLSYRGGGEAGVIRLPSENRMYVMLPGEDGSVVFQERENQDGSFAGSPPVSLSAIPPAPNFIPPPPPKDFEGGSSNF